MNFRTAGISDWRRLGASRGEFSAALGSERGAGFRRASRGSGREVGLFRGDLAGVEVPAGRVRALTPTVRRRGGSR